MLGGAVAGAASEPCGVVCVDASSTSISFGKVTAACRFTGAGGVSVGTSAVDRPNHPSQPEEVVGRWGVSAAGGGDLGVVSSAAIESLGSSLLFTVPLLLLGLDRSACASAGVSCGAVVADGAVVPLRPAPFSVMLGNAPEDSFAPSRLAASEVFFVSYLLKSAVFLGLDVPPWIVSFATWVEAEVFGTRGQDPYQLFVL